MKVGILYICTGKYIKFWDDFYHSSKQFLLPDVEKKYFVFTDGELNQFDDPNVQTIFQKQLPFPYPTLYRFRFFLSAKEKFSDVDYLLFFNSNIVFQATIYSNEILPSINEKLVAVIHPGYYNKKYSDFPLEKNKKSIAFFEKQKALHYYMGSLIGGVREDFIQACESIDFAIKLDETRGVIAVWHDETHWNKYLSEFEGFKILHPGFVFAEGYDLPYEMKALLLDKSKMGGHNNLRKLSTKEKMYIFLKKVYRFFKGEKS